MSANTASLPAPQFETAPVSTFRFYLLRTGYLLLVVGLGSQIWPLMFHHRPWNLMHGVANSFLAAISALAVLGLRYPLKMLPLLFFEMFWKVTWLIGIALPLWRAGNLDAQTADTVRDCLMVVIFLPLIPWRYVIENYLAKPGDRWR